VSKIVHSLWPASIKEMVAQIGGGDKIIVLKDSVVAEEGTNDELIVRDGVYAE